MVEVGFSLSLQTSSMRLEYKNLGRCRVETVVSGRPAWLAVAIPKTHDS
jgi:hypothetical protein